jgi:hypothetical protein
MHKRLDMSVTVTNESLEDDMSAAIPMEPASGSPR